MPIKIVDWQEGGEAHIVPRFVCDACGEIIDEAALGLVTVEPGAAPRFFHKNGIPESRRCGDVLDTPARDGGPMPWHELGAFIIFLGEFANINWEHASCQATMSVEPWLRDPGKCSPQTRSARREG